MLPYLRRIKLSPSWPGSLPPSYSTLITALEARDAVTLGYVQQSLIRKEQRLKESHIQHTGLDKMSEIG